MLYIVNHSRGTYNNGFVYYQLKMHSLKNEDRDVWTAYFSRSSSDEVD